jgi:hypothetical protein
MEPVNVGFQVDETQLPLWERDDCFLMRGRGNCRSGTASRYVTSSLLGNEYTRGAIIRAVKEDIRTSCRQEVIDGVDEEGIKTVRSATALLERS